jgi:hypothetical protein
MNKEFKQINLINLNVFQTSIDSVDNKKLLNEIENYQSEIEQKYLDGYLNGGGHTYYEDKKFPKLMPESSLLFEEIENAVTQILGKSMKITEIWTLTLNKGESVSAHSHKSNTHMHPDDYYSIAYYPSAPQNSSKLIFNVSWCNTMENLIPITPKEGMLLIFNSYIHHLTNRHDSETKRVVVSANLRPEIPNTTAVPDWSAYD